MKDKVAKQIPQKTLDEAIAYMNKALTDSSVIRMSDLAPMLRQAGMRATQNNLGRLAIAAATIAIMQMCCTNENKPRSTASLLYTFLVRLLASSAAELCREELRI